MRSQGEEHRERENPQADFLLTSEPHLGLGPRTVRSWPEQKPRVGHLTVQAPLWAGLLFSGTSSPSRLPSPVKTVAIFRRRKTNGTMWSWTLLSYNQRNLTLFLVCESLCVWASRWPGKTLLMPFGNISWNYFSSFSVGLCGTRLCLSWWGSYLASGSVLLNNGVPCFRKCFSLISEKNSVYGNWSLN